LFDLFPSPQGGREETKGRIVLLRCYKLCVAAAAAIVLSAGVLHAALPNDTDTSGRTSFAGQLLIAAPALQGSPFERTVILMAQHSREGALGVVINRPLGERPLAGLLQAFGADATGVTDNVRVFLGGPVSPEIGFVVHSADYRLANTIDIDGKVALTAAPDVLRDIAHRKGPGKSLVAFGYAGWGPSQLDGEIARGDWFNVVEDPALVFDDDRANVWTDAMARRKEH
jgi:putative transcriptional regulator